MTGMFSDISYKYNAEINKKKENNVILSHHSFRWPTGGITKENIKAFIATYIRNVGCKHIDYIILY